MNRIVERLDKGSFIAQLLIRLSLAAVFVPTGWGKLHDLEKVTGFFTELHIPWPHLNAIVVALTEFGAGSLILIGFATRLAALPLIFSMSIAILTAKRDSIGGVVDLFALDEFLYIVLLVALVFQGAGLLSVDRLVAQFFCRRKRERTA